MIRMGVSECFFWYWPTWIVPGQTPLNDCVCYMHTLVNAFSGCVEAVGWVAGPVWFYLSGTDSPG